MLYSHLLPPQKFRLFLGISVTIIQYKTNNMIIIIPVWLQHKPTDIPITCLWDLARASHLLSCHAQTALCSFMAVSSLCPRPLLIYGSFQPLPPAFAHFGSFQPLSPACCPANTFLKLGLQTFLNCIEAACACHRFLWAFKIRDAYIWALRLHTTKQCLFPDCWGNWL